MRGQDRKTEDPAGGNADTPWRGQDRVERGPKEGQARGDSGPSMEGAGLRGRGLYPGGRAGAKVWEGQETGKPARFMEGPLAPLPYPFP